MSTLADIRKAAETPVHTCVDDTCPAGHFLATTKILGIVTTYLLAGALDDPQATIIGRIEMTAVDKPVTVSRGSGVKGGEWLSTPANSEEAFRKMIERANR